MSANNWRQCPNCLQIALLKKADQLEKVAQAYGKVSKSKYDLLVKESEKPVEVEETLRENYQLGVDTDGQFYVHYSCCCRDCSFAHKYVFQEELNVVKITQDNNRKNNQ